MALLELDEERIESDDNSQFKVVIHTTKFGLKNTCENIRENADLSGLKGHKFSREE